MNAGDAIPGDEAPLRALRSWIDDHQAELIADAQSLLQINSVESDAAPNAPYGAGCREALDLVLRWAESEGLPTTDLEGHFGYATLGDRGPLVMAIGHLDVVPPGAGWTHPPFGAELHEGAIYARGASDDKGPSVAMWYAVRAIQAVAPDLPSRIRIGFGCDEESGFQCISRYTATEEAPQFAVAPDAGWPCYNAEKGICDLRVRVTLPEGPVRLVSLRGGSRPNIVIDEASATVRIAESEQARVRDTLDRYFDRNLTTEWAGDDLLIKATGKAAHGSTPFAGDSAVTRIFRLVLVISSVEHEEFYEALLNLGNPSGEGLGIHGLDSVTGLLSSNLGIADGDNGSLTLLFNVRYNIDTTGDALLQRARAKVAKLGGEVELVGDSAPLYFPADHPLVRTIVEVYAQETGEAKEPGSMGGGTYARALKNAVAIGTGWMGDGPAHQADERIAVASLVKAAKIYAILLYRLAMLAGRAA